jgi:hypothetical protein
LVVDADVLLQWGVEKYERKVLVRGIGGRFVRWRWVLCWCLWCLWWMCFLSSWWWWMGSLRLWCCWCGGNGGGAWHELLCMLDSLVLEEFCFSSCHTVYCNVRLYLEGRSPDTRTSSLSHRIANPLPVCLYSLRPFTIILTSVFLT